MTVAQRLPHPYRDEAEVVAQRLHSLQHALDWANAAQVAVPWVQAVRDNPAVIAAYVGGITGGNTHA